MCAILHSTPAMSLSAVTTAKKLHTDSHASHRSAVWREWKTILSAKSKLLYSERALSQKPFGIGHVYIYAFLLRMTENMTSQNIDISSWDTRYITRDIKKSSRYLNFLLTDKKYRAHSFTTLLGVSHIHPLVNTKNPWGRGERAGVVVKALRYKLAGRGFDSG
jgi:hypothetical protein